MALKEISKLKQLNKFNLQRETLTDKIVEVIENRISSGELVVNTLLSEKMIADEFGVSRGPARESLLRLEEMDLVKKTPAGRFVKQFSIEEFRENHELKMVVEAYCCRQGSLNATKSEITKIQKLLDTIGEILNSDQRKLIQQLNIQFHESLVLCSRNKKLIDVYRAQTKKVSWAIYFPSVHYHGTQRGYNDHKKIFDAFVKKDANKVRTLTEKHQKDMLKVLLNNFNKKIED